MEEPQTPPPDAPEEAPVEVTEEATAPIEDPAARRKRALLGLAAAIVIGGVATGVATYAERYTGWVARVEGARVSKSEYDRLLGATKAQYQQRFNVDFATLQGQQMETDLRSGLMIQLVERELIRQEAKKRNIQVSEPDVDAKLAELKKGFKSDAELAEKLKSNGLDLAGFRAQVREQLEVERVVQDVTRDAAVGDAEVKAYYDEHLALYDKKQEVHARHILVKDEAVAKNVQAKLKAGGDFAALAKEYSEDQGSKVEGGDLGFFARGRMVKEFEEAAFTTKPGQVTPLVKTRFGYHIIKVEAQRSPRKQPFSEVASEIRDNLSAERRRSAFATWLEGRKLAAAIDFQPGYKPAPRAAGNDPGEDGGHGAGDGHGH